MGAKGTIIDAHFMELWSVLAQSGKKIPKFRILLAGIESFQSVFNLQDVEAGFKDKIKSELHKMSLPTPAIEYVLHSICIETYPTTKLANGRTDHSQMPARLEELLNEYQEQVK